MEAYITKEPEVTSLQDKILENLQAFIYSAKFCLHVHHKVKIGMQCVHVSAILKFNDHVGKKAMHASRTKDICVLSP